MPNPIIMIQARTGSKRFPTKVLSNIQSKPMIWHVINRLKKVKSKKQIVLITTKKKSDKVLLKIAEKNNISSFSGDENNVLNRHYECAKVFDADPIIRITSDCPLIDPNIVENILQFYLKHNFDFVSNAIKPSYPDGLDTEIISFSALQKTAKLAKLKQDREHVTTYITNHPKKFKIHNYSNSTDLSSLRWTVDRFDDLVFVRKIYSLMRPKKIFHMEQILKILEKYPDLLKINSHIDRNEGHALSLKKHKKNPKISR